MKTMPSPSGLSEAVVWRSAEEGVASAVGIGLESDPAQIPLEGELRNQFGEVDFIVYVPDGVDIERVRADVERYKLAMITFKIQVI